jgi:hypothetical protein
MVTDSLGVVQTRASNGAVSPTLSTSEAYASAVSVPFAPLACATYGRRKMNDKTNNERAFVLVRQSGRKDKGDSIEVQDGAARAFAAGKGLEVIGEPIGGSNLSGRKDAWYRLAAETVERAAREHVGTVLVPWGSDRFMRNERNSATLIERADELGVELLTTGGARLTFRTADEWERNRTDAIRDEAYARRTAERVRANKAGRVRDGLPVGRLPKYGYATTGERGKAEPRSQAESDMIRQAWRMAGDGRTVNEVRDMAAAAGFPMTYPQAQTMLSRSAGECYLGRVVFGDLRNDEAHEPIIDLRTFERRFAAVTPRNGKKSDDLLARLGVLRCDRCGARLVVGTGGGSVPDYRHPAPSDCSAKRENGGHGSLTIPREHVLAAVVHATRRALLEVWGSSGEAVEKAEREAEKIEARLAKARRLALDSDDEAGFAEMIRDLVAEKKAAAIAVEDARAASGVRVTGAGAWDDMDTMTQRELIATVLDRVEVTRLGEMPEGHDRRDYSERLSFHYRPGFERQAERVLDEVAEGIAEVVTIGEAVAR